MGPVGGPLTVAPHVVCSDQMNSRRGSSSPMTEGSKRLLCPYDFLNSKQKTLPRLFQNKGLT